MLYSEFTNRIAALKKAVHERAKSERGTPKRAELTRLIKAEWEFLGPYVLGTIIIHLDRKNEDS